MHKFLTTTIFVMAAFQVLSQQHVYDPKVYLEWNEYNPLEWTDFKGHNPESYGDAGTKVRIIARPYLIKKNVYYNVYALFDMRHSWANEIGSHLLAHEQLHFDIAELYARKIRLEVEEMHAAGVSDLKVYNRQIKSLLKESNDYDHRYDLETLHGSLTNRQREWNESVANQLENLILYKSGSYTPKY